MPNRSGVEKVMRKNRNWKLLTVVHLCLSDAFSSSFSSISHKSPALEKLAQIDTYWYFEIKKKWRAKREKKKKNMNKYHANTFYHFIVSVNRIVCTFECWLNSTIHEYETEDRTICLLFFSPHNAKDIFRFLRTMHHITLLAPRPLLQTASKIKYKIQQSYYSFYVRSAEKRADDYDARGLVDLAKMPIKYHTSVSIILYH